MKLLMKVEKVGRIYFERKFPDLPLTWPFLAKDGKMRLFMSLGTMRESEYFEEAIMKDVYLKAYATHILCVKHEGREFFTPLWRDIKIGVKDPAADCNLYDRVRKDYEWGYTLATEYGRTFLSSSLPPKDKDSPTTWLTMKLLDPDSEDNQGGEIIWKDL